LSKETLNSPNNHLSACEVAEQAFFYKKTQGINGSKNPNNETKLLQKTTKAPLYNENKSTHKKRVKSETHKQTRKMVQSVKNSSIGFYDKKKQETKVNKNNNQV
jgi:hypothetical protein